MTNIENLGQLEDGWLEGKGVALNLDGIGWLSKAFDNNYPNDLQFPYIFPTAEGNIQAEWSIEHNEATLEIDLMEHQGKWHNLNLETDAEETNDLNLNDNNGWVWLVEKIRQLFGDVA